MNRHSKLAGPSRSAQRWTSCHSKITCTVSQEEEFKRYQGQWHLTLHKSGKNAPMRLRSDFRAVVSIKNRLHRESGEEVAEPISPQQYRRWHYSTSDLEPTILSRIMPTYLHLFFEMTIFRNSIQNGTNFYCQ